MKNGGRKGCVAQTVSTIALPQSLHIHGCMSFNSCDCLEDSSHMVILHPRATSASSIRDYMRLCSIICTYQTFEVVALDGEISDFQPPILLLSPLAFPKSNQDSSSITVQPLKYIFSLS